MTMHRVLCSTGALITKRNGRDYELLRTIVPQTACDGLEFMMYQSWHDRTDALKRVLCDFPVPVFHMTKQIGEWISQGNPADAEAMFRADCELARAIGAKWAAPLHIGLFDDMTVEDFPFEGRLALPLFRAIALGRG